MKLMKKITKITLLIFYLVFVISVVKALNVNITVNYNDTIQLNNNNSIKINVSTDNDQFEGILKVFFVDKDNNKKEIINRNFTKQITVKGDYNIDKLYKNLLIDVINKSDGKIIKEKSLPLYVYDLSYSYIKLEKQIIEEDEDVDLKIKFKFGDDLDKEVKIYLDNSKKESYSFDDKIDKKVSLDFDNLYKEVKVKVFLEDNKKEIFEKTIPVLVYNIEDVKFDFDDYKTLNFETDEFELSNPNNKVELKIEIEDLKITKYFKNKENIGDFDVDILEGLSDSEKINLIEDLLNDLSEGEIKVDYKIKIYLYNDSNLTKEIDSEEVEDEDYKIKDYDNDEIQTDDSFDIKLDVLEYNDTINSYSTLKTKVKTKINFDSEDEVDVETCAIFNGIKKCKSENFEEDDLEEKVFDFYFNVGELEDKDYYLVVYAKDDDEKNIIWKFKKIYVDNNKVVNLKVINSYLTGKKDEKKNLQIELRNIDDNRIDFDLILDYNGKVITKHIELKGKEKKVINIPITLKESGTIIIRAGNDVKLIGGNKKINVKVFKSEKIEIKTKTNNKKNKNDNNNKENNKKEIEKSNRISKEIKEKIECNVDKDTIYSNKNKVFLKINSEKGVKIKVNSEFGNVLINPKEFVLDEESKTILIEKTKEGEINDIIKITCEKNGVKKEIEVPLVIETKNWINYIIYGGIIGASVLLVFLIIVYILV